MNSLILATASPYKKSLMKRLGITFQGIDSRVDESIFKKQNLNAKELTKTLAKEKAISLKSRYPGSLIIGADQVCHFENKIYDKPENQDQAFIQLKELQSNTHELITSYYMIRNDKVIEHTNTTKLKMSTLSNEEIFDYLNYDKPYDCAGSYKIESGGIALFDEIFTSDFTAIIGLPLLQLSKDLQKFEVEVWKN